IERQPAEAATVATTPTSAAEAPVAAPPVIGLRREGAATAPANGAAAPSAQEKPVSETVSAAAATAVSEPAPAKRVPKVAIGSKYVPPEGKEPARAMFVPPPREEIAEAPAATPARKAPLRTTVDEESAPPAEPPTTPNERIESLLEQIFLELR